MHVRLAVVPAETGSEAGDDPADAVLVRCDALSGGGGGGGSSDAHSAAGGGDWRTAMLLVGEAYPAETPCVEFQSSASGFGSRQASSVCCSTIRCLRGHQKCWHTLTEMSYKSGRWSYRSTRHHLSSLYAASRAPLWRACRVVSQPPPHRAYAAGLTAANVCAGGSGARCLPFGHGT